MKLDSEVKAVSSLVFLPENERGSGFHPIPGIGWRFAAISATDLTPLESFLLRIGTGPKSTTDKNQEKV
jgi:hypothetical protein